MFAVIKMVALGVGGYGALVIAKRALIDRRVFVVCSDISLGPINVTESFHKWVAGPLGFRVEALKHWSLIIYNTRKGTGVRYDLMSNRLPKITNIEVSGVLDDDLKKWAHYEEIGLTDKTDEELEAIAQRLQKESPIYHIVDKNCHSFTENMLREICNVKVDLPSLKKEVERIYPGMRMCEVAFEMYRSTRHRFDTNVIRGIEALQRELDEA